MKLRGSGASGKQGERPSRCAGKSREDASAGVPRHLGRRARNYEREKYLFARTMQGIEFGRQMLLEHKHATRLQSEVQLLTQEKVGAEEQVEALLEEISEFEEAVTQLEKEMHD